MIGYIIGGTILNLIRLRGKPKPSQAQYLEDVRKLTEEFEKKMERHMS